MALFSARLQLALESWGLLKMPGPIRSLWVCWGLWVTGLRGLQGLWATGFRDFAGSVGQDLGVLRGLWFTYFKCFAGFVGWVSELFLFF
jgi:hypothetical protein